MKVAIIVYGGGRAFVQFINGKENYIHKDGLQIHMNFLIARNRGVYNQNELIFL
ncbi:hypothetical protein [Clostridium sp.]|jgi:hypothetical protein|uniref:hypothetical protein n=1 Tax=Clostridium sp. TaxID=1506 RepID=UPI003EE840AA